MYTTIWLRKLNNKDVKEIELSKINKIGRAHV